MSAGIWNMLLGVAAIVAGASGRFTLVGTNSTTLLVVVGVAMFGYGLFQTVRHGRRG
mgnify:CR=1 FL=1